MPIDRPGENKEEQNSLKEDTAQDAGRRAFAQDADQAGTLLENELSRPGGNTKKSFYRRVFNALGRWVLEVTAPLRPPLKKAGVWIRKKFGKYISPAFLVMLFLSFVMWFIIKLGYTYVTEIPVNVNIEGNKINVSCVAEGEGYSLFANRYYNQREINLRWSDVEVTPSATNPRAVVISPYSLQNAISVRKPDVKIISMSAIPEVEL